MKKSFYVTVTDAEGATQGIGGPVVPVDIGLLIDPTSGNVYGYEPILRVLRSNDLLSRLFQSILHNQTGQMLEPFTRISWRPDPERTQLYCK